MKGCIVAVFAAVLCAVSAAPTADQLPVTRLVELLSDANSSFVVDQYVCIVNVFEAVSTEAGLDSLWDAHKEYFTESINKWRACEKLDGTFARLFCNVNSAVTAYSLLQSYTNAAQEIDPVFYARFGQQYFKTCLKTNPFADAVYKKNHANWTIEHLKCIVGAVQEALDKTPYEQLWAEYEKVLKEKLANIYACKDKPSPADVKECILTEVHAFGAVIKELYGKLENINSAVLEKIRKSIKEKCYSSSSLMNVL